MVSLKPTNTIEYSAYVANYIDNCIVFNFWLYAVLLITSMITIMLAYG